MAREFFSEVQDRIAHSDASDAGDLSFQAYDPDRIVLGKRMEEHLRAAVCYWHSFNWPGNDVFGAGTYEGDPEHDHASRFRPGPPPRHRLLRQALPTRGIPGIPPSAHRSMAPRWMSQFRPSPSCRVGG